MIITYRGIAKVQVIKGKELSHLLPHGIEPSLLGISPYPATLPVSYSEAELRPFPPHMETGLTLQEESHSQNPTHLILIKEDGASHPNHDLLPFDLMGVIPTPNPGYRDLVLWKVQFSTRGVFHHWSLSDLKLFA